MFYQKPQLKCYFLGTLKLNQYIIPKRVYAAFIWLKYAVLWLRIAAFFSLIHQSPTQNGVVGGTTSCYPRNQIWLLRGLRLHAGRKSDHCDASIHRFSCLVCCNTNMWPYKGGKAPDAYGRQSRLASSVFYPSLNLKNMIEFLRYESRLQMESCRPYWPQAVLPQVLNSQWFASLCQSRLLDFSCSLSFASSLLHLHEAQEDLL